MVPKCILVIVTFSVLCTNLSDSYTHNKIDKMRPDPENVSNELLGTTKDSVAEMKYNTMNNSSQPDTSMKSQSRSKRSVFNLISMIHCATDCSVRELMDYGNYCGWGGSGRSMNSVDSCCKQHDNCYGAAIHEYGFWSSYSTYIRTYKWYCNGGDPFCSKYQPSWRRALCYCDLELTRCLNDYGCPY